MKHLLCALLATLTWPATAASQERFSLAPRAQSAPARLRGVVYDRALDAPVSRARVQVVQAERTEILETDEAGEFVTKRHPQASAVSVQAWDNAAFPSPYRQSASREPLPPSAEPGEDCALVFRIDAGARYELDLELPPGVEAADLEVGTRRLGSTPGQTWALGHQLELHPAPRPWIRVPSRARFGAAHTVLAVETLDGRFGATLDLPEPGALDGGTLRVALRPRGVLTGRVEGPRSAHGTTAALRLRPASTRADGRRAFAYFPLVGYDFRIAGIDPGQWTVEVTSATCRGTQVAVVVPAAGEATITPHLGEARGSGALTLRVVDPAGSLPGWEHRRDAPELRVWLCAPELPYRFTARASSGFPICGTGRVPGRDIWFEPVWRAGRRVYEATFEDLPDLAYTAQLDARHLVDGPLRQVRVGQTVEFEIQPRDPTRAYRFEVVDAATGEATSYYHVEPAGRRTAGSPPFPLSWQPDAGGAHSYGLPDGLPVAWSLYASGFQRVYGDRSAFDPAPSPGQGHVARVELNPGFRVRLRATDPLGTPLPGVAVGFDGSTFVTGTAGITYLESDDPSAVRQLSVDARDIVGGNVEANGTFPLLAADLELVLR